MVASPEHPELNVGKKMLTKVWSYTVDFCIRFRTIPDNPTWLSDISREILIEHPSVGLASLAQLIRNKKFDTVDTQNKEPLKRGHFMG